MSEKYKQYAKEIPIRGRVGNMALWALMEQDFFGWDSFSIRYGLVDGEGVIPEETEKLHTHDYDQILWFLSSHGKDMLELGAEVEFTIGEELTRRRFTEPTAILIPAGTPHFSPLVREVNRPFFFMSVNCAGALSATVTDENAIQGANAWAGFMGPYARNFTTLSWARRGAYHYGSEHDSNSGGVYTGVMGGSAVKIPLMTTWQTIGRPHELGPLRPSDGKGHPHVHADYDEALIFLSMDTANLTDLHGEADFCFGQDGDDQEHYTVTRATAMLQPKGVWHLPLIFNKADPDCPMVFLNISQH